MSTDGRLKTVYTRQYIQGQFTPRHANHLTAMPTTSQTTIT